MQRHCEGEEAFLAAPALTIETPPGSSRPALMGDMDGHNGIGARLVASALDGLRGMTA